MRLVAAAAQILGHCKAQANPMALFILAVPLKGPPMARLLLGLAFLALPIVELALLIKTGQAIGFWPTLGLVVAAAVLGSRDHVAPGHHRGAQDARGGGDGPPAGWTGARRRIPAPGRTCC